MVDGINQLNPVATSIGSRLFQDPTWRRAANRSNLATALALPTQVFFFVGIVDWKDGSWLNNYFPANITLLSRLDFCFMSFFPVKHAHVSHDTGQNCVCVCVRVTQWWSRHELLIQLTFQIFLSKVNNEVEAVVTLSATWSIKGATLWKYSHLIHYSM